MRPLVRPCSWSLATTLSASSGQLLMMCVPTRPAFDPEVPAAVVVAVVHAGERSRRLPSFGGSLTQARDGERLVASRSRRRRRARAAPPVQVCSALPPARPAASRAVVGSGDFARLAVDRDVRSSCLRLRRAAREDARPSVGIVVADVVGLGGRQPGVELGAGVAACGRRRLLRGAASSLVSSFQRGRSSACGTGDDRRRVLDVAVHRASASCC